MKTKAYSVVKAERVKFDESGYSPVYGELTKKGVHQIFRNCNMDNKILYDMGSGIGNVIINAWNVSSKWKKVIGIELSEDRHNDALLRKKRLQKNKKERTHFYCNDIFNYNYCDADYIYISNLCFPDKINRKIGEKLDKELKPGTIIFASKEIYLSIPFERKTFNVEQSWSEKSSIVQYFIL